MRKVYVVSARVFCVITISTSVVAGWLIYHEPGFKGKVIDVETRQAITGTVVVVMYQSYPIIRPGRRKFGLHTWQGSPTQ